jgi:hypothetical protein
MRMGMEILKLLKHEGRNKNGERFLHHKEVPLTREPTSKGDRIPILRKASELGDCPC